jgi:hypothetical protein
MDEEALVEAVTSAHRPRDPAGAIQFHPCWWDLDAGGRRAAFLATASHRALEAALDPEGLSATGRAVLARIEQGLAG